MSVKEKVFNIGFTDAELDVIYNALNEYQSMDDNESEMASDIMNSIYEQVNKWLSPAYWYYYLVILWLCILWKV